MKKLLIAAVAVLLFAPGVHNSVHAGQQTVIYYFESPGCPACARANEYLNNPVNKAKFSNAKIVRYDVQKNLRILVNMLEDIKRKKGQQPFIIRDRMPYEYYQKNGIPYHRREERYSRRDEPLPVPLFIVKDMVYVGFSSHVANELVKAVK